MKRILIALLLTNLLSCIKKNSTDDIQMTEVQQELLSEHDEKSFDVVKDMAKKNVSLVEQTEKTLSIDTSSLRLSTKLLPLPVSIEVPKVIETENYFYVYNLILSPELENIAQYDKTGKLIKTFGRKGYGPGEITTINSISEKNHITYVFDNGQIKRFNESLEEIDRKFLKLWVNDVKFNTYNYDARVSDNKIFPYPISNIDSKADTINFSIKDIRPGALNFISSNETSFYSNDSLLIYAKTTLEYLHIIDKSDLTNTKHYKIKSPIIRKNEQVLDKKNINQEKFYSFMNSLFLIDKMHFFENNIWITFVDRNSNKNKYYLGKFELKANQSRILTLKVFDISESFKTVQFFEDHLFYTKINMKKKEVMLHMVKLKQL